MILWSILINHGHGFCSQGKELFIQAISALSKGFSDNIHSNAFFLYRVNISSRSTKEFTDCEIIAIPGRYDYKPLAFGYQLNSPYAGVLDYHIKLTRENGALDQVITKYQRGRQFCPDLR